jgi:hypothetical protein
MNTRLDHVLSAIDEFNRQDPRGQELPYSERLTGWVLRLEPDASEPLRIAARGQHIGRWTVPRDTYPLDRGGYLSWREELKKFHAKTVADIMEKAGYPQADIEKTRTIILKKYQIDSDAQTIVDALCLVFLETQFDDLIAKTPRDKMIGILKKTWNKMSERGRLAALALNYSSNQKALLQDALHP